MQTVFGTEAFEPRYTLGLGETTYQRALHALLVEGNHDTQMVPGIASAWEVSADGFTWIMTIPADSPATFHNGDPVTINDVEFSFERYFGKAAEDEATSTGAINWSRLTDRIEITGPETIEVTHNKLSSSFPFTYSALQSSSDGGSILPQKYHEEVGEEAYADAPIGAGPFRLVEFKRSEQLLFEQFPDYYYNPDNGFPEDRRMKFKTLDMRLVPEESTRVAALIAGEADIVEVTLQSRPRVEAAGGRYVWIEEGSYTQVRPIGCWLPGLPCNDKRVRYALDYAIDKELIRDNLYGGTEGAGLAGFEAVTPSTLGYSPELDATPYDPEMARQLLAEAGYPGGEGYPPFTLYTWQASDTPFMVEHAELIAQMWQDNLGLDVTVEAGQNVSIRERVRNRELDGHVYFRSNEGRWDGGSLVRSMHYLDSSLRQSEDPELVRVADEGLSVMDPALRHDAYNKMYLASWEEHYSFSTIYTNLPLGLSERINTYQPWPLGPYPTALWTVTLNQ
jgi:peptide/nickel transport system substrate-binding protein